MYFNIKQLKIFTGISSKTEENIIKYGNIIKANKNEILFMEKDYIDKVYILLRGKLSLFKINESGDRKVIFILNRGDIASEINLELRNHSVSCDVFEDALILEYEINDFFYLLKHDFELTKNIINYTERRNRRLYRQVKNSISIKLDKRLAAKLYKLAADYGINTGEWILIDLKISITYLSDMLGCQRESLSRAMKTLEKNNIVKVHNKIIYVKKDELAKYFKCN